MFRVNDDGTIHVTRGDSGAIEVSMISDDGTERLFKRGDVVRLNVHERKRPDHVVILVDINVDQDTDVVVFTLGRDDTKIGELINKPVNYWYEIELNPDTVPETLVGYDDVDGPKIFRLFPEGGDTKWE